MESFYTLAKQLPDPEASKRIASFDNGSEIDVNLPEYEVSMKAWEAELHQLARSEKAKSTVLAAGRLIMRDTLQDSLPRSFGASTSAKEERCRKVSSGVSIEYVVGFLSPQKTESI